jgi:acetyl esterase/lipase
MDTTDIHRFLLKLKVVNLCCPCSNHYSSKGKNTMIRLIFFSIFILLKFNVLFSQTHVNDKIVTINVNILNPCSDIIEVNSYTAKIDSNNTCSLQFEIAKADFYLLKYANKSIPLFLTPLDNLHLYFDDKDINNTLTFSGRGAHYNNYLFKINLLDNIVVGNFRKNFMSICSLDEKSFTVHMDSLKELFQNKLNDFISNHENINEWFIKHEKASNLFGWAESLIWYPYWYKNVTKKPIQLSKDYYQFVEELNIDDPDYIPIDEYESFMNAYMDHLARERMKIDKTIKQFDNQWNTAKLNIALELFHHSKVKDHWLYQIIFDQIDNYGIKNIENLIKIYEKNCSDSKHIQKIRNMYDEEKLSLKDHAIETYKSINNFNLDAHIFYPENFTNEKKYPTIVYFHGGGWSSGKYSWHFGDCQYYASLGMIAISAEYCIFGRHGTGPLESISDAKSIIRWLRKHADELGIDPDKIVTCGYSAGGHIAACTAMIDILDEPDEELEISCSPNAMVFYYCCFDPTLDKWFVEKVSSKYNPKECSPNHNIRPDLPPSLVLHGTNDRMCPFWTAKVFVSKMKKAGNHCVFHVLKGAGHIFQLDEKYGKEARDAMNKFLQDLGYL